MILFLPLQIFDIGPDHLLIVCVIEKKKSKMFQYFFWNCSWPHMQPKGRFLSFAIILIIDI